jgi:hypothetical protein
MKTANIPTSPLALPEGSSGNFAIRHRADRGHADSLDRLLRN